MFTVSSEPQRLEPPFIRWSYGPAEAGPFQGKTPTYRQYRLLGVGAAECVDHAHRDCVLIVFEQSRAEGEWVLIRDVAAIFQTADDALRDRALQRRGELAQMLRGAGGKTIMVVEAFTARREGPFVVEGVLDVAGDATPGSQKKELRSMFCFAVPPYLKTRIREKPGLPVHFSKHKSSLKDSAGLVSIPTRRSETGTRRHIGCVDNRNVAAQEERILVIARGQREPKGTAAGTIE